MAADPDTRGGWTADRPMVLYGAGGAGRAVARHLKAQGVTVAAFLDAEAAPGETRDGIPTHTLAGWLKIARAQDFAVLVSIHNPYVAVAPILDTLRAAGFARVLSMADYANLFPPDPAFQYYWLTAAAGYAGAETEVAAARALLADDESRRWFDALMRLRLTGNYHGLPEPRPAEQYLPADLPRWAEPMRLIDCGAYDGDTLVALQQTGYRVEAVVAFEPDPANYANPSSPRGPTNVFSVI